MTELTALQMKALTANLNPGRVAKRSQSGSSLSYLEAWDIRATLTRVFGFAGWSADLMEPVKVLRIDEVENSKKTGTNFRVLALATVRLTIHQTGATYTESAAQSQSLPDIGEATDFAVKTAESDALKRAAINLGTQFGLSLYDDGSTMDVIKVVLAPGQHETLEELRNPTPKPDSQERVDPDSGEVLPVPGEDPADDAAMALVPPVPSPASRASALDAVRGGFDRNGRS